MATKPVVRIPVWASGGSTTDPGAGKETAGWDVSEKPPATWMNWLDNAFGRWLSYFEDATDEALVAPIRAYGWFYNSDTADAGNVGLVGAAADSAKVIVQLSTPLATLMIPNVQMLQGSAANGITAYVSPIAGGEYVWIYFYTANGAAVDPSATDVDFLFTAAGVP